MSIDALTALIARVEVLESRVTSLEETRAAVDMLELIEGACTCGVKATPGKAHATECALSQTMRDIAMRAGS